MEWDVTVDYQTLEALRRMNPGWRLLTATHAPFVASFLHEAFIRTNIRTYLQSDLAVKLDDQPRQDRIGGSACARSPPRSALDQS